MSPLKQAKRIIASCVSVSFLFTSLTYPNISRAQTAGSLLPWMPKPGVMVHLSPEFTPAILKGMIVHPENALKFDFLVFKGDAALSGQQEQGEYKKLIKYFLASLAIPDEDQWVNLSPYEKGRMIKEDFGKTEMGRDLLAQDYILKQITASLIYPQDKLGQKFWDKVYAQAYQQYGTTNISVNTFNKVWIVPDDAVVYEKGNMAYVVKNHLKVMLEEDYLSLEKHTALNSVIARSETTKQSNEIASLRPPDFARNDTHSIASQIVRDIVLPALEKEVNEGKNFAMLRQVFSGMVLAAWYKRVLKESLLSKIYADKAKVKGIDQNPKNNEEIYQQYLKAFKKGVFNFIQDDVDKYTHETIPRKYFSGGATEQSYNRGVPGINGGRPVLDTERTLKPQEAEAVSAEVSDEAIVTVQAEELPVANAFQQQEIGRTAMTAPKPAQPSQDTAMMAQTPYSVAKGGEKLEDIALKNGITSWRILQLNPQLDRTTPPGQVLPEGTILYLPTNLRFTDTLQLYMATMGMIWFQKPFNFSVIDLVVDSQTPVRQQKGITGFLAKADGGGIRFSLPVLKGVKIPPQPVNITPAIALSVSHTDTAMTASIVTGQTLRKVVQAATGATGRNLEQAITGTINETNRRGLTVTNPDIPFVQSKLIEIPGVHKYFYNVEHGQTLEDIATVNGIAANRIAVMNASVLPAGLGFDQPLPNTVRELSIYRNDQESRDYDRKAPAGNYVFEQQKAMQRGDYDVAMTVKEALNEVFAVLDQIGLIQEKQPFTSMATATLPEIKAAVERLKNRHVENNRQAMGLDFLLTWLGHVPTAETPDVANLKANIGKVGRQIDGIPSEIGLSEAKADRIFALKQTAEQLVNRTETEILSLEDLRTIETYLYQILRNIENIKRNVSSSGVGVRVDYTKGLAPRIQYTDYTAQTYSAVQAARDGIRFGRKDSAMKTSSQAPGGIDFNAANLNLQIKRDGNGVPLPMAQQNLENIHIDGLIPIIMDIKPAASSPLLSELTSAQPQSMTKT